MASLYITSIFGNSGKTMLSAGLGKIWQDNGRKVGYLKISTSAEPDSSSAKDSQFMRNLLGLQETVEVLCPIINDKESGGDAQQAYSSISKDKEIVIIEGLPLNVSAGIIEALDAKVIVIHDYPNSFSTAIDEYKKLGVRLLGVVVNKVPRNKAVPIRNLASESLSQSGINLLGLVPEDRVLMTISIAELAEVLQGKILNSPDKSGELIESFMMGSSTFDRGPAYYGRKKNKAVFLWGERPGYRKAALAALPQGALQTSTKCIVISANGIPVPAVAQKAEEQQVPIISAPGTITDMVTALEDAMGRLKFIQEQKMPHLLETLRSNLDFKTLSDGVGLAV